MRLRSTKLETSLMGGPKLVLVICTLFCYDPFPSVRLVRQLFDIQIHRCRLSALGFRPRLLARLAHRYAPSQNFQGKGPTGITRGESFAQLLTCRRNRQKPSFSDSLLQFPVPVPSPQSPVPSPQSPVPSPQSPVPSPQSPVPSPSPSRPVKLCRLGSLGNSRKPCPIRRSQRCLHAKPCVLCSDSADDDRPRRRWVYTRTFQLCRTSRA